MKLEQVIQGLGYSKQEAMVYITALKKGESTVSEIAELAQLPRSSAQLCLSKLHENGLVNFYIRKRYKYWTAGNPQKLLIEARKKQDQIQEVLPELLAMKKRRGPIGVQTKIKVLKGQKEMDLLFEDMLEKQFPISAVLADKSFFDIYQDKKTWLTFLKAREQKGLSMRVLVNNKKAQDLAQSPTVKTKVLASSSPIDGAFFLYGPHVAFCMNDGVTTNSIIVTDGECISFFIIFYQEKFLRSLRL